MKAIYYIEDSIMAFTENEILKNAGIVTEFRYTNDINVLEKEIGRFCPDFVLLHAHKLLEPEHDGETPLANSLRVIRDFERIQKLTRRIKEEIPDCIIFIGHNKIAHEEHVKLLKKKYPFDHVISEDQSFSEIIANLLTDK
jgi:hypothetical protein